MKIPRRGEKGFTLVELLIVLAIMAVLAAVVIPNVTGMMGRGSAQAWDTDKETIQMSCATFYFDVHDNGTTAGHYYPTDDGASGTGTGDPGDNVGATIAAVETTAGFEPIYMGLLVNTPAGGGWVLDGSCVADEKGPYLNDVPESCSTDNSANGTGTYTWVIGASGKVYGLHFDPSVGAAGEYVIGFGDVYP